MPRPRFTIRRMMIAAIVAILIGGTLQGLALRRSSEVFLRLASEHSAKEQADIESAEAMRRANVAPFEWKAEYEKDANMRAMRAMSESTQRRAKKRETRAAYHAALSAKYERAARYPWLPVAPDPPEPE